MDVAFGEEAILDNDAEVVGHVVEGDEVTQLHSKVCKRSTCDGEGTTKSIDYKDGTISILKI